MKKEFLDYLKAISVSNSLITRIQIINQECQMLCHEEICDIFVNEFIKGDGSREYESLWLFTETSVMEAKQFTTTDDYDLTPIKNKVYYWNLNKKDYDLKTSSEKSRLFIRYTLENGIGGVLQGSKNNCDYLMQIFVKYLISNFKA